jgi:hypothetical protein
LRFQPQELGGWGSCCLLSDCPQQNPAWLAALLMCRCNAAELGGILSIARPFRVKRSFLASSTVMHSLLLSYNNTTKRSMFEVHSLILSISGLSLNVSKSLVTSSKTDYVSHAVFFPRLIKDDT